MPLKDKDKQRQYQKEWQRIRSGDLRTRCLVAIRKSRSVGKKRGHLPCLSDIDEVVGSFTGYCKLCGVNEKDCVRRLSIDHCHTTGQFRGWLCQRCNTGLGLLQDDPELLRKATNYLEQYGLVV